MTHVRARARSDLALELEAALVGQIAAASIKTDTAKPVSDSDLPACVILPSLETFDLLDHEPGQEERTHVLEVHLLSKSGYAELDAFALAVEPVLSSTNAPTGLRRRALRADWSDATDGRFPFFELSYEVELVYHLNAAEPGSES